MALQEGWFRNRRQRDSLRGGNGSSGPLGDPSRSSAKPMTQRHWRTSPASSGACGSSVANVGSDPTLRPPHRRRWLSPLRALQLAQSTPGRAGSGSPPSSSGTGWSAASSPGRTGCGSRCQPGQVQPWAATCASTVRFASRCHADVRRTAWSGVLRKRFAKPGRPQRSQRCSFVVGQPQALAWCSQPRQAQTRERAIDHRQALTTIASVPSGSLTA